jgi:ADP-heptose:LPS heptosyltransferase
MSERIVLIRPCCIGDVVLATAALHALRNAYPQAHITWAVGGWSQQAIAHHPAVDALLDTGADALPVKSVRGFLRFVRQLRRGDFDIAVSLVRSPLMSLAVALAGIPTRAGIDSKGRGFGYTHRYPIDPHAVQHEAEIYLRVVAQLGVAVDGYRAHLPVTDTTRAAVRAILHEQGIPSPYVVINPTGGNNPGMTMSHKRWLPRYMAQVATALYEEYDTAIILLGAPDDLPILAAVQSHLTIPTASFAGTLSFAQIGALAAEARVYIGNDTGLTHLAAASGAKTVMILGPTDPRRYAPYTDDSLVLWQPVTLQAGGVARADRAAQWDWARDGITPDQALPRIRAFLADDD